MVRSRLLCVAVALAAVAVSAAKKKHSSSSSSSSSSSASSSSGSSASYSSSAPSGHALLTIAGTYDFVASSLALSWDLATFAGLASFNFVWQFVPPAQQSQAEDQWEAIMMQIDTVRLQNGIPKLSDLKADLKKEWGKRVVPVWEQAVKGANAAATVPQQFLSK